MLRLIILIGFLPLLLKGQKPCEGYVYNSENQAPIEHALVILDQSDHYLMTDKNGYFFLQSIEDGVYRTIIKLHGFHTLDTTISLPCESPLKFYLKPDDQWLKSVGVVENHSIAGELNLQKIEVNRQDLLNQSGISLTNRIANQPGVQSLNVGPAVGKPMIRGMSMNRVLINQNGLRHEGQQWGSDHGLEMDAFGVDRVEIIKGPGAFLYGSDATSGVINIENAPPPQEGDWDGEAMYEHQTNMNLHGGSVLLAHKNKRKYFRARASYKSFGDIDVPAYTFKYLDYVLSLENERLKNTAGKTKSLNITAGMEWDRSRLEINASTFDQQVGLFAGAIGIPRAYQLEDDGDIRNIDVPAQFNKHDKVQVKLYQELKNGSWTTLAGWQRNFRQERSAPHVHGNRPEPEDSVAAQFSLETWSLKSFYRQDVKKWVYVFGLDGTYFNNQTAGFEYLVPDYESTRGAIFGYAKRKMEQQSFSFGGRLGTAQQDVKGYKELVYDESLAVIGTRERTPEFDRFHWGWALSVGWTRDLEKDQQVRLNIARTYRVPSIAELAMNGVHHGTFRHERGAADLNLEIGYQSDFSYTITKEKWRANASLYYNYFTNYIYLSPSGFFSTLPDAGQVYQYREDPAVHTGGELSVAYQIWKSLSVHSSAEYVYAHNMNTYLPLPLIPPFKAINAIEWNQDRTLKTFNHYGIRIGVRSVAAQTRVDRNERTTPGYHLVNATAKCGFQWGNQHLDLNVSVVNLMDVRYLRHLSRYRLLNLPEMGRNFRFQLRYHF